MEKQAVLPAVSGVSKYVRKQIASARVNAEKA